MGATPAAGGGAAVAAIAQAIKASGIFVQLEERDFQQLLYKADRPLVVVSRVGLIKKQYQYMFSHRGFVFSTKSATQVHLPSGAEVIAAARGWVPT